MNDYYRDDWPQIVHDCFARGGRMFTVIEQRDESGRIVAYQQGRELDEAAALEFRGMTMTVYDDSAPRKC